MMPPPVHVSIHDVAPPFRAEVERALELTGVAGARPALLVVPDHHGRAPLASDPAFCAWLRGLQSDGHELYLHGFFHAKREPVRGVSGHFAQRVASAGEAELSELPAEAVADRVEAGERAFAEAGLRVDGFVPPAWAMPPSLLPVLAARAYAYTEDHFFVYSPRGARRQRSVVYNYASRSPARLLSSVALCRIARPLAAALPARIAIHPADMDFLLLRREIERLLAWGRGRFVARGRDLVP